MVEVQTPLYVSGTESSAFGSFSIDISDDQSAKIALPVPSGFFFVTSTGTQENGLYWFRGNAIVKLFSGTSFETVANTALDGTTGSDGVMSFSTNSSNLYVENRLGSAKNISLCFIGISNYR